MILPIFFLFALPVYASSQRSYQDYLYQYDQYRQNLTDFQTAKNTYLQFQSLAAQTDAYNKTKLFLTQRDNLFKAYLLLLSDKLDENPGVSPNDKGTYQQLLASESAFLTTNAQQIPGAISLNDVTSLSPPFENQYKTLQRDIRKVLIILALGQLTTLNNSFQTITSAAQAIVTANATVFPTQKQATINQWVTQIQLKEQSYQKQYADLIDSTNKFDGYDVRELDQKYNDILKGVTNARQLLIDGASNLIELKDELKYIN